MRTEKFESALEPGIYYWAEFNERFKSWVIMFGPDYDDGVEGYSDWFPNKKDAEDIARQLANDEILD